MDTHILPTVKDVYADFAEAWKLFASQPGRIASVTVRSWRRRAGHAVSQRRHTRPRREQVKTPTNGAGRLRPLCCGEPD